MHCEGDLPHQGGNRFLQSHCHPEVPHQKGDAYQEVPRWVDKRRARVPQDACARVWAHLCNVDFKTNLVEHWRTYVAKNHRTSYKRARAVETVGKVEEYDKEDTLLDLPDDNFEQMALPFDGDASSEE